VRYPRNSWHRLAGHDAPPAGQRGTVVRWHHRRLLSSARQPADGHLHCSQFCGTQSPLLVGPSHTCSRADLSISCRDLRSAIPTPQLHRLLSDKAKSPKSPHEPGSAEVSLDFHIASLLMPSSDDMFHKSNQSASLSSSRLTLPFLPRRGCSAQRHGASFPGPGPPRSTLVEINVTHVRLTCEWSYIRHTGCP